MKILSVTFFLLLSCVCLAQQNTNLRLETRDGSRIIPVYIREGTPYIPAKQFADALRLSCKVTGPEAISISGIDSELKITAKNPFYIVSDRNGNVLRTYQIPTSTYSISGQIYIPVIYSLKIFNEVLGAGLKYDENSKIISQSKKELDPVREEIRNSAYDISIIKVEEKANGTLIKIMSNRIVPEYNSSFADGILTVSLTGVRTDPSISTNFNSGGLIKQLDIIDIGNSSELRFHLGDQYSASEIIRIEGGNDLLLTIHNKIFTNKNQDRSKDKWDFDVIVLDPGHGGKDAGAVGINGVKEKDINLEIALILGELIQEKMPGVKVEYTRKTDTFVELYKRGRIANEKNGKLFISVHCNSTPQRNSSASGFEVYLLRPGRTQEAINIAERENSVIEYEDDPKRYQQLTDENFILVSMAHSSYMKYSEKFSEYIDSHFSDGFDLSNRGVKQAGFYVLVGASMPSVLVEAGFLSNKTDAAYLNSKKGQEKTAELLFESIKSFKGYYESFLGMQ